jgi:hypothetical protein
MKKALGVLLVGCLLAALPFALVACGGDGGADGGAATEGQLPTFEMGDTWVFSYMVGGADSTLTEEVIGEEEMGGRECYVLDMTFDPPLTYAQTEGESIVTGMTYWGDKATAFCEVTQYYNDSQIGAPIVSAERFVVESREVVSVTAGTFDCFKIVIYGGDDAVMQIVWWSDEVESMVKSDDGDGNTIMELLSYSVS